MNLLFLAAASVLCLSLASALDHLGRGGREQDV